MHDYIDLGEVHTPAERALVEERYRSLRRQVPIIYLIAVVNLFGLHVATGGEFAVGFNIPTALLVCAIVRIAQWWRAPQCGLAPELMLSRLRQTFVITVVATFAVCLWCLWLVHDQPAARLPVLLFGSLTALATAYGLSSLPAAARLSLMVLALPLAVEALLTNDRAFIGAGLSICIVAGLNLWLVGLHNRQFVGLVLSRELISRERERAEIARFDAHAAATTDLITGLPNRRAFLAALGEALVERPASVAVALLDIDRFKRVNDTFGHGAGDELLRVVAGRIAAALGEDAMVARLAGDEFAVLWRERPQGGIAASGRQLLHQLNRPADIHGHRLQVSACCGIATASAVDPSTPSRFVACADTALYAAKGQGAGKLCLFDAAMELPRRRRVEIEQALQQKGWARNIDVLYQPIVDLRSGRIKAVEALARWSDPELGPVPPSEFVPVAEQLNLIAELSDVLLALALPQTAHWDEDVRLSFNLSAVQLGSSRSAETILKALDAAKVAPHRLQVEVTETALLRDFATARANLQQLREAGVTVVMDDFGAGYASIGYLREIAFDQIKLDGSLVSSAQECPERRLLLSAVIGLCRALRVEPVAEHIETEAQLRLLVSLGCSVGQGYWLYQPLTADAARALLQDQ
ncbi:MAG TPA: EAL domain-containing protein, partial [Sphingomicrobium sp.]|nr:EAL domain-containing protein [Sphingomicrobium sp.]